ncbi:Acyltransferase 3 domain-containing protein [Flavobacterium longum]|uniref:acyltransferase family protein n=1 Tax=Flavobacterium longum TaxID=1299340 RepID=UPI0039ECA3AD
MVSSKNQNRIFGLDLMRATAILLVLAGHCAWIFPHGNNLFTALLALAGFLGVEIFFVLSGFLIGRIIYRQFTENDFNLRAVFYFLKRRWYRTFPNYFLILVVNIAIAFALSVSTDGLWRYFFFLQNFAAPMLPFFTESWSLSVEEFAYVILPFALLLFFLLLRPKDKSRQFLAVILLLIFLFFITKIFYHAQHQITTIDQWNLAVKSVVIYRLDSIFIGVLAAWLSIRFNDYWRKTKFLWAFLGLSMIGFYTFGVGFFGLFIDQYPFFWNVVYLPLASVSIALFLPVLSGWQSSGTAVAKGVTFVSLISYSIYLLHYGVVLQLMKHYVATETLSVMAAAVFTAIYLSVTVLLSWLLYRYYEKPMMDKRDVI